MGHQRSTEEFDHHKEPGSKTRRSPELLSIKCVALQTPSSSNPLHSNKVEEETMSSPSDQLTSVVPAVGGRLRYAVTLT